MRHVCFAAVLCLGISPVSAAVLCVGTSDELTAALQTIRSNGEADTLRLRQGSYVSTAPGGFDLRIEDGTAATVSGGWSGANGTCTTQHNDPRSTIIDGQAQRRAFRALIGPNAANVSIANLAFVNGNSPGPAYSIGSGLTVSLTQVNGSEVLVERCLFQANQASSGAGLALAVPGGSATVRNNLFSENIATVGNGAASLTASTIHFNNNTVADNISDAPAAAAAVSFYGEGTFIASNNILWGNTGIGGERDLYLQTPALLVENIVGVMLGTPDPSSMPVLHSDPRFIEPGDYRLRADSPARDRGAATLVGLGAIDVFGHPRVQGGQVDLGALEFDAVFRDGFENQ